MEKNEKEDERKVILFNYIQVMHQRYLTTEFLLPKINEWLVGDGWTAGCKYISDLRTSIQDVLFLYTFGPME